MGGILLGLGVGIKGYSAAELFFVFLGFVRLIFQCSVHCSSGRTSLFLLREKKETKESAPINPFIAKIASSSGSAQMRIHRTEPQMVSLPFDPKLNTILARD